LAFDINSSSLTDVGVYTVTLTSTITQPPAADISASTSFTLNLINGCEVSTLIPPLITRISIGVNMPVTPPINIFFTDTWEQTLTTTAYCGARAYTISSVPALPNPILSITTDNLSAISSSMTDINTYSVTITASLPSWPSVTPIASTFTLQVACAILSLTVVTQPPAYTFFQPFVDPPLVLNFGFLQNPVCGLNYTLIPMPSFVTLDSVNGQITLDPKKTADFKTWNFTLNASPLLQIGVQKNLTFQVEIQNLCMATNFYSQNIPNLSFFKQDPSGSP
jgi:hypothetical protein